MKLKLTDQAYDVLNNIVKYIMPAFGTFYFGLAQIWNLPAAEQVVGTIVITTTLLAIILAVSKSAYKNEPYPFDGDVQVREASDGTKQLVLFADTPIDLMEKKGVVQFQITHPDTQE